MQSLLPMLQASRSFSPIDTECNFWWGAIWHLGAWHLPMALWLPKAFQMPNSHSLRRRMHTAWLASKDAYRNLWQGKMLPHGIGNCQSLSGCQQHALALLLSNNAPATHNKAQWQQCHSYTGWLFARYALPMTDWLLFYFLFSRATQSLMLQASPSCRWSWRMPGATCARRNVSCLLVALGDDWKLCNHQRLFCCQVCTL